MRKFQERLPTTWAYSVKLLLRPWCVWVRMFVYLCVHLRSSIEHHRKSMDFSRERGYGTPYLAAPPTAARVQNRVEFVELARGMSSH